MLTFKRHKMASNYDVHSPPWISLFKINTYMYVYALLLTDQYKTKQYNSYLPLNHKPNLT